MSMRILSVNIGASRTVTVKHREVQTGIYKTPVSGPVPVTHFGLPGDVRVETRKMGLEHSAVYAYPFEHYAYWQQELGREAFPMGQFGENLTVTGMLEEAVRIGDVFRFGSTILQVAHPRIPCAKLNERMGLRFSPMFLASRKVGYYLRVLQEGELAQGDEIELLERDEHSPSMEEFVRIAHYEYWDAEALQYLLRARDLMPAWRETLESKLARTQDAIGWHGLREFEMVRREPECADTVSLYFKCVRGKPLPTFRGGQQITVVLGGHSAHQHRRAYAISSSPHELESYRITVCGKSAAEDEAREDDVSAHLVSMKVGERILCSEPRGLLMATQEEVRAGRIPVLLCQGLGLAPTLSLLYEFEALQGVVPLVLYEESACEPQGLLRETQTLLSRNPAFRFIRVASSSGAGIDATLLGRYVDWLQADIHIAGPRSFTERVANDLSAAGISSATLRVQSMG